MKALVTGATGFIGAAVARALISEGTEVRVLVRPNSDVRNLRELHVEQVYGDLRDRASLRQALRDCQQLYHVAAHYALWAKSPDIFYDINVTGTRLLMEAAREVGTERIVYTSTIGAIGLPPNGGVGTEKTPVTLSQMAGHYKRSKYLAEQEVLTFAQGELPVIIVNPSAPVGAGDVKPTPTGQMIVDFMKGRMWAYIETGMNLIDVDDVAIGAPSRDGARTNRRALYFGTSEPDASRDFPDAERVDRYPGASPEIAVASDLALGSRESMVRRLHQPAATPHSIGRRTDGEVPYAL